MFLNRIIKLSSLTFIALFISTNIFAKGAFDNKKVYVWSFYTPEQSKEFKVFTESITDEVEQALINKGVCEVLQRRKYQILFDQKQQELNRKGLEGVNNTTIVSLKTKDADLVLFGEVYDDPSGKIKISAYVQNFDGQIPASTHVFANRSIILDPIKRKIAIDELIRKLITHIILADLVLTYPTMYSITKIFIDDSLRYTNFDPNNDNPIRLPVGIHQIKLEAKNNTGQKFKTSVKDISVRVEGTVASFDKNDFRLQVKPWQNWKYLLGAGFVGGLAVGTSALIGRTDDPAETIPAPPGRPDTN